MLSSSPEKLRAMKEKMKKVLGSMRKKSTHSGVIDEDIRSTYSAVSMDEPSITSAATSMRTSRSKVGSAFVPVTKTTLPKDISISSPEVVSAKVDEEEDFNSTSFFSLIFSMLKTIWPCACVRVQNSPMLMNFFPEFKEF